ncbi:MAG: GAF and ANTAR domain-containing protein [Candidatus Kerfeldbacteria bacterium]|nr:GAF and ANTAR domain-containing protein [Candidatus Kerfeldbacteria bacterium]
MTDSIATQLKAREQEIAVLKDITRTIASVLDLDGVLANVIALVRKTMHADACLLYLTEDSHDGKMFVLRASQRPKSRKKIGAVRFAAGSGITGWVAEHGQTVVLEREAYKDQRFVKVAGLPEDDYEAFISVPILFRTRLVGVMNVQYEKPTTFSQHDVELLEMIGQQVGGAIHNAELLAETEALKSAIETRKTVDKAKAILMKRGISEDDAHMLIRKKSMDSRKTLREIAEAIVLLGDL